jgi:hypothetical protein
VRASKSHKGRRRDAIRRLWIGSCALLPFVEGCQRPTDPTPTEVRDFRAQEKERDPATISVQAPPPTRVALPTPLALPRGSASLRVKRAPRLVPLSDSQNNGGEAAHYAPRERSVFLVADAATSFGDERVALTLVHGYVHAIQDRDGALLAALSRRDQLLARFATQTTVSDAVVVRQRRPLETSLATFPYT